MRKNDAHSNELHIECKRTDNAAGITLKVNDLKDCWRNAAREGREPLFAFEVGGRDYYVIDPAFLEELLLRGHEDPVVR